MMLEEGTGTVVIKPGFTLVGDNAYVKKPYVATPLKGVRAGYEDGYNFYLSQLRITIERVFGMLVHRWSILRAPLTIPIPKVAPMMESLIRLHNYCINESEDTIVAIQDRIGTLGTCTVMFVYQESLADQTLAWSILMM